MINLISREKLEHIARSELKYTLQDAEKDYFLTLVMRLVSESALSNKLVFKGGTSIYHCYLDQYRFSEDLDFTSLDKGLEITDIEDLFDEIDIFEIKKKYESNATLKIERLKYEGVLEVANSIKFEVDRFQNVALPALEKEYRNVWGLEFSVNVMDPIEICAEKIRACNDRFRYRDFYDLYMMINELKIEFNSASKLLERKEIRNNISKERILRNVKLALNEVDELGDTVEYKKTLNSEKLKNFIENLNIPNLRSNVNPKVVLQK
jgi:predicted nucleotidyltransferase component of viral defense system